VLAGTGGHRNLWQGYEDMTNFVRAWRTCRVLAGTQED
jgi:hypothetical protein